MTFFLCSSFWKRPIGKSPRDGQFTGIAKDGAILRTDILVLPISTTGNRADKFLVLIYAEEAQNGELD